jgi:IS30 family transposase
MVTALIRLDWSPEQISGWLKENKIMLISHETIYRYIWYNKFYGGKLYLHLRQAGKIRRKRYKAYDSRGILATKRHISERPLGAENKTRTGHWEIDTVMGARQDTHCIVTLVDRKTKFTLIGKLLNRSVASLNQKVEEMILQSPFPFKTITADNGTEFHGFEKIERTTGTKFYFATPHHSWERGLNENTNGLIRQYLPKKKSMSHISQEDCDQIATKLNRRPRKTLKFKTPEQFFEKYI